MSGVAYAKAKTIYLGMRVAEAAASELVIIKSDCSKVVNQNLGKIKSNLELLWIISKIQKQMQRIKDIKMQLIFWTCNGVAHDLAKMALKVNEYVQRVGACPPQMLYLFFFNLMKICFL